MPAKPATATPTPRKGFRISYNAPVVLTFAVLAVAAFCLCQLVGDRARAYFVSWPHFYDYRSYLGLVTHILGHGSWDHLLGNFSMILLIGPILEERHGSRGLLAMIVITALVTGFVNVLFVHELLLGASGIVFMMILLASVANVRAKEIPLTFIAVVLLFMGREVVNAFHDDQISQMAHLVGGAVGAVFGFLLAGAGPTAGARPAPKLADPLAGLKKPLA